MRASCSEPTVLFDVQTTIPAPQGKWRGAPMPRRDRAVRQRLRAVQIVDARRSQSRRSDPVLMTPGRGARTAAAPIDQANWQQYGRGWSKPAARLQGLADARPGDGERVTNVISDACANCHRVYRDVPTNALRCTPPKP